MTIFAITVISPHENEHTAARRLLHELLNKYSVIDPSGLAEVRGEHGKPHFADMPSIAFSLSHSGELAACALSLPRELLREDIAAAPSEIFIKYFDRELYASNIGCDIQLADGTIDMKRMSRISERFLATSSDMESSEKFFSSWVRAESIGKCLGTGLPHSSAANADILCESTMAHSGKKYFFALAINDACEISTL